jgi:nicotinate-nucleotide pyrophosphorylase (carboxylating)
MSMISGTGKNRRHPQDAARLRLAQKYAVRCGGGTNHRLGLYDGI